MTIYGNVLTLYGNVPTFDPQIPLFLKMCPYFWFWQVGNYETGASTSLGIGANTSLKTGGATPHRDSSSRDLAASEDSSASELYKTYAQVCRKGKLAPTEEGKPYHQQGARYRETTTPANAGGQTPSLIHGPTGWSRMWRTPGTSPRPEET